MHKPPTHKSFERTTLFLRRLSHTNLLLQRSPYTNLARVAFVATSSFVCLVLTLSVTACRLAPKIPAESSAEQSLASSTSLDASDLLAASAEPVDDDVTSPHSSVQPPEEPTSYSYRTEELWVDGRHGRIYGVAYIPEGERAWPLVICSHGLGGTHLTDASYAEQLAAHGYAAYTFDFNGGSAQSQSEGSTLNMSAQTEADDLEDVMDESLNWDFVDHDRLFLFGESQGGLVSAITASRRPQDVDALCLLFPAFVLIDYVHDEFGMLDNVPETFSVFGWIDVGRQYAADVWDYAFEQEIGAYTGPVLLVHGSEDVVVPYHYSERAAAAYTNAEYHLIEGANHGFSGEDFKTTIDYMLRFFGSR